MRKAEAILAWAVEKMEERYALLARAGVRHITSYNQLGEEEIMDRLKPETEEEQKSIPLNLPFIVIIADEIADLMMTAGKEVEQHIIRLAQKSRAVGIHLILATQKPTVDVITGLIKSNLPARISFQVASRTDSRVVLDEMGAEKLLGNGDMLFLWPGTSTLLRGQGTYLTDEEINRVVDAVSTGEQHFVHELVNLQVAEAEDTLPDALKKRDDLYEAAVDVVVREGRGSVSLLQRALGIGYGRAARLIDFMAEDGIVGPYAGSQAREVTISVAEWERMHSETAAAEPETPAPKPESPRRQDQPPQGKRGPAAAGTGGILRGRTRRGVRRRGKLGAGVGPCAPQPPHGRRRSTSRTRRPGTMSLTTRTSMTRRMTRRMTTTRVTTTRMTRRSYVLPSLETIERASPDAYRTLLARTHLAPRDGQRRCRRSLHGCPTRSLASRVLPLTVYCRRRKVVLKLTWKRFMCSQPAITVAFPAQHGIVIIICARRCGPEGTPVRHGNSQSPEARSGCQGFLR